MSPKFQTWGGREGTPKFWTWAWKGAEGPESSGIGAARRIPEVMGLGLEKAENMVPKFWTRNQGRHEDLEVPRLGTAYPEVVARTGRPTPDACGDSALTGAHGVGFARTSD